jgi:hypothetical protein
MDKGILINLDLKICAIVASSLFLNIFIETDVSIESCKTDI